MARNLVASPGPRDSGNPDVPYVLSYFALRKAVGIVALAFLAALVFYSLVTHKPIEDSLSAYYYTPMSEVFTGSLCAIGLFLIAALGYEEDKKFSVAAGVLAFCVAFFHCTKPDPLLKFLADNPLCGTLLSHSSKIPNILHGLSAMTLFCVLSYFCIILFRKSHGHRTGRKMIRNRIYLWCGIVMLAAMALFGINLLLEKFQAQIHFGPLLGQRYVLLIEFVCLYAFGIAWLVKGEAIAPLNDPESAGS